MTYWLLNETYDFLYATCSCFIWQNTTLKLYFTEKQIPMEDYLCTFYGCITWWVSHFSSFVCNSSRQNYLNFHHNEPVHRIKVPKFALFYFSSNFCICFYFFKMPIYMSFLYVNENIFSMEKWLSGTEIFHIFRSCSIQ